MKQFGLRLALITAVALVASACGTDETTEAGSPLAEFLGQDLYGPDISDVQAQAEQDRAEEEAIAACMADQGFEYIPFESPPPVLSTADGLDIDSREYAAKYGFGITTEWFLQQEVGPELVGVSFEPVEEVVIENPNTAIVEEMDDATRLAYEQALFGDERSFPTVDESMTVEELQALDLTFEPQGCQGQAWAREANNAFYQDFDSELQQLYASVDDDPRLQEQQQQVNECVNEEELGLGDFVFNGLDAEGYGQVVSLFEEGLSQVEDMVGGLAAVNAAAEESATLTKQELEELYDTPREFSAEAKELLGQLQAEEVALAVAVFDCGGSTAEQEKLYQEIAAEYEEQFLSDYADRLAAYKADR